MPARKPQPPRNADNPEQSRRFIDAAREVGADETPGATDLAFEKVIGNKSVDKPEKAATKRD